MIPILLGGLMLRLALLSHFPFFTDEAIYTYWARSVGDGSLSPFIPLFDGKTVLFVWATTLLLKVGVPILLAGRIISALSYLGIGYFLYRIAQAIIPQQAKLALALYALNPFAVFFERMAIMDPLMTLFMVAATYFFMNKRFALTGVLLMLAFLTKPTAQLLFIFAVPVLFILLLLRKITWRQALLVLFPTVIAYWLLSTSSGYSAYQNKNREFIYSFNTHWLILVRNGKENFLRLGNQLLWFMSPFVLVPLLLGIWQAFQKRVYALITIAFFTIGSFIGLCLLGKVIFSRHLYFLVPYASLLIAASSYHYKRVFIALLGVYFIINSSLLIFATEHAFLGAQDKDHYVTGTASGYDIAQTVAYLEEKIGSKKALVIPLQNFGNFPYTFDFMLSSKKNIMVKGAWKPEDTLSIINQYPSGTLVYLIYNHTREDTPRHTEKTFWRPQGRAGISVLRLDNE